MITLTILTLIFWFSTLALFWFFAKGQNRMEDEMLQVINDLAAELRSLEHQLSYHKDRLEMLSRLRVQDKSRLTQSADDWK